MAASKIFLRDETPLTIALLGIETVLIVVFLAIRNSGIYPVVFADEWIYSTSSRLTPFSQSTIPSYVFFLLFKTTNVCGVGFLACARIFNAAFFALSLPLIYSIARQYLPRQRAFFIASMAVLGPVNSYATYFMPEAMFFFAFWAFVYFVLSYDGKRDTLLISGAGAILGIMAMIKLHAVVLLSGLVLFVLLLRLHKFGKVTVKDAASLIVCSTGGFLVTRLLFGYVIAGRSGISLVGEFYWPSTTSVLDPSRLIQTVAVVTHCLFGHLLAVSMLFGVPIAIICGYACGAEQEKGNLAAIRILGLAFLVVLLLETCVATAAFATADPDQIRRLHMRYYNFMFPLFLIIAAIEASSEVEVRENSWRRWMAAVPLGLLSVWGLGTLRKVYSPNVIDSPELRGFIFNAKAGSVVIVVGIISLMIWAARTRLGAMVYVCVFLPMALGMSSYYTTKELRQRLVPDVYDDAGMFTRLYVGDDASKLVIAGANVAGLFRVLFHVDNARASIVQLPPGGPLEWSKMPAGTVWVLIVGNHALVSAFQDQLSMGEYSLFRMPGEYVVDFRKGRRTDVLSGASGLAERDGFGRWSEGKEVSLVFKYPLPKEFRLRLRARAFGPNAKRPFKIKIGDTERTFTLGESLREVSLMCESSGTERVIRIVVPLPTSPKELGWSQDERRLGIALQQLRVEGVLGEP
jgi:phosphoglycerol transferase